MAGGQALDLAAEGRNLTLAELEQMHALKTGALIRASVLMAALCAAGLDARTVTRALERFGAAIGLAFQVQDDILDVAGDEALSASRSAATGARQADVSRAAWASRPRRERVAQLHAEAIAALGALGWHGGPLAELARMAARPAALGRRRPDALR